jgi:hypothetical protein
VAIDMLGQEQLAGNGGERRRHPVVTQVPSAPQVVDELPAELSAGRVGHRADRRRHPCGRPPAAERDAGALYGAPNGTRSARSLASSGSPETAAPSGGSSADPRS